MPLKLPQDSASPPSKTAKKVDTVEPLRAGDSIEYSITMEVSPQRGQKAWLKFGTTSSVRDGESTEQARKRITDYVEAELDRRLDDLA